MRILFCLLTIPLFFVLIETNFAETTDNKFELTYEQKNFAKSTAERTAFVNAEWVNSYVLNVTLQPHWSGQLTKEKAQIRANLISAEGYLYMQKDICVKITDPKFGELAYECKGDQSES